MHRVQMIASHGYMVAQNPIIKSILTRRSFSFARERDAPFDPWFPGLALVRSHVVIEDSV